MGDLRVECYRKLMKLSWRIIKASRQNLSQLGFAWNQYTVMKNIQPGEAVMLSEICSRAFKENSNVTALIDFLEEKGIAERVNDKNDRRIVRVQLTEEGTNVREKVISGHEHFIREVFMDIYEDELTDFIKMLDLFQGKLK